MPHMTTHGAQMTGSELEVDRKWTGSGSEAAEVDRKWTIS